MSINPLTLSKIFTGTVKALNEKYGENQYTLKTISINCPVPAEDNFLSEIYSVTLKIARKNGQGEDNINFIVKSQLLYPGSENDPERYGFNLIFTKEMLMYTTILERMENLLQEIGESNSALFPKLHHYYTEGETYSCLFLDNLIAAGFYIPETHGKGMKLDECSAIMKSIARFHALSLIIEGQDELPLPQKHQICAAEFFLCDMTAKEMVPIVKGSYEGIIQLAEKYRPDLIPFMEKVNQEEDIWNRLCALVKPDVTSFSCLAHGDARLNNIFINKEDIENIRFIDFQLTRYASPLTDLQYLFHVGATKEFREENTEEMLRTYHKEFKSILNKFSSVKLLPAQEAAVQGWTFEKLKEEYESLTMYGFLISTTLLPIILLRPGDIDKAVGQMEKEERNKFWHAGRKTMVYEMGCKHADVRQRLFDICDEAAAFIQKRN